MTETLHEAFAATAARLPDHPFLHIPRQATAGYRDGPIDFTYAQAGAAIDDLAARYRGLGIGLGHRVALALDNRPDMLLHFLALNGLGASIVPVNAELQLTEKSYLLDHGDAVLVVALDAHQPAMAAALAGVTREVPLLSTDLRARRATRIPAIAIGRATRASEAGLLYTSGTTGKPKGCMLSNDYMLAVGEKYLAIGGYCRLEHGRERVLTPLPLSHMNALCCTTLAAILSGGCLIQLDRFHPGTWWQTVRESRASFLHYLGVMPAMLLSQPASADDDFSGQIRFGFGAGVDPRHHQAFERRFGFPLIEAWSMTEVGAAGWISAHAEPRHVGERGFGKAPPGLEYRIVDEAGQDVAAGAPGELLIRTRGPDPRRHFFSGYYKDEPATEAAWDGGYFHTGDVVRVDEEGSFFFVDRRKNVIRRSGENIAAAEVESVLLQHPAVLGCAVCPVPDEVRGEEVMAAIVLRSGHPGDAACAESIFAYCAERLVYFKAPGYLAFVERLPTTASQKVQRGELKALCAQLLAGGAVADLRDRKRRPGGAARG